MNTFTQHAFTYTNPGLRVASHTHAAAQVVTAVRMGVPTVVLIRQPRDVAISLMQYLETLDAQNLLSRYIAFYRSIMPYAGGVVLVTMKDATTDLGRVIRSVNKAFRLNLHEYSHAADAELFTIIDEHQRRVHGQWLQSRSGRPVPDSRSIRDELISRLSETPSRRLEDKALSTATALLDAKGRSLEHL